MPTHIDTGIREHVQLASLVDKAEVLLQSNILDSINDEVTVDWDLVIDDCGRPAVDLKLSDYASSVSRRFTPEDLTRIEPLEFQLAQLRRELLLNRSKKHLKRIKELLAELKED